jgi:hypothetical protein
MCSGPICIAVVQGIPAALVTLTIGIVGGLIAYHQATVTQAKLKLGSVREAVPYLPASVEDHVGRRDEGNAR